MKIVFCLFFFLCIINPLKASEDSSVLEELIEATKNKLEEEKRILRLLNIFNECRTAFMQDPESAKLATKLVNVSLKLQDEMEKSHLSDIFSKELLEEITFFCEVGKNANSLQR